MEKFVTAVCVGFVILTMNVSAGELDFLQTNAGAETAFDNDAGIDRDAATIEPAANEPKKHVSGTTAPDAQTPAEPAAAAPPPARHAPAATLDSTPALDYAADKVAVNDVNSSPWSGNARKTVQLAANPAPADRAGTDTPDQTESLKLEPMKSKEFDQFLVAENFKLPLSRKIHVADADTSFANVWLEHFTSRTSGNYREMILTQYGQALVNQLKKELSASGWQIVDSPSSDAIRLKPRLFDIYIVEPETTGLKETIVAVAGQAGVELVFNTPNDQTFMKLADFRNTPEAPGSPFIANRANNFNSFKRLMTDWTEHATKYLNGVMSIFENRRAG